MVPRLRRHLKDTHLTLNGAPLPRLRNSLFMTLTITIITSNNSNRVCTRTMLRTLNSLCRHHRLSLEDMTTPCTPNNPRHHMLCHSTPTTNNPLNRIPIINKWLSPRHHLLNTRQVRRRLQGIPCPLRLRHNMLPLPFLLLTRPLTLLVLFRHLWRLKVLLLPPMIILLHTVRRPVLHSRVRLLTILRRHPTRSRIPFTRLPHLCNPGIIRTDRHRRLHTHMRRMGRRQIPVLRLQLRLSGVLPRRLVSHQRRAALGVTHTLLSSLNPCPSTIINSLPLTITTSKCRSSSILNNSNHLLTHSSHRFSSIRLLYLLARLEALVILTGYNSLLF